MDLRGWDGDESRDDDDDGINEKNENNDDDGIDENNDNDSNDKAHNTGFPPSLSFVALHPTKTCLIIKVR